MVRAVRAQLVRWFLLLGLVLAVVAMHHLNAGQLTPASAGHVTMQASAMPGAADAMQPACCDHADSAASGQRHEPSGQHQMLHLCLAVLGVAVGLRLSWLLFARGRVTSAAPLISRRVSQLRAVVPLARGAPALLSSLCVLRL